MCAGRLISLSLDMPENYPSGKLILCADRLNSQVRIQLSMSRMRQHEGCVVMEVPDQKIIRDALPANPGGNLGGTRHVQGLLGGSSADA
jgi:hypothetical protein